MLITAMALNVGRSRRNRTLALDLFYFVKIVFILEPPVDPDGQHVPIKADGWELFSFVKCSGVEVFVRAQVCGLFDVVGHGDGSARVGYWEEGERRVLAGAYFPPTHTKAPYLKHRYMDLAGCEHVAQLIKFRADTPEDLIQRRPAWKKVDWEEVGEQLDTLGTMKDGQLWGELRKVVDALPRASVGRGRCEWWTPELERMRKDVNRLRPSRWKKGQVGSTEDYRLARCVYRASLVRARFEHIRNLLTERRDPDIFRLVEKLESKRTLPSMVGTDGTLATSHADISDLIAQQLSPGEPTTWSTTEVDMEPALEMDTAITRSPNNTGPGVDDMGYPFLRFWRRRDAHTMRRLLDHGLRNGIPDWHQAEVVLIPKAGKPRYDLVKSWRMIHLLPAAAKVAERIVLLRLAACLDLGETQFGSRHKRGVHDATAVVLEFLQHNEGYKHLILSMDIEGGFDNISVDLLSDFLIARGCPTNLRDWVWHWTTCCSLRFRFDRRVSKVYHVSKVYPQGSPLSPFLFGAYVADVFTPRMRYSPGVRQLIVSYVDDGVIMVAARSCEAAQYHAGELFADCDRIARARGMGFSALKTQWIGFGDKAWDGMDLMGECILPSEDLRVLGYWFNVFLNFSAHVRYWLDRGLGVRKRIAALGRRYGSVGGLGAWETYRLVP